MHNKAQQSLPLVAGTSKTLRLAAPVRGVQTVE